ncbi:secretion protein HlyD [Desulfolutivibrio sp.]|uniref:secretion protein HlyD n=1 Tax=Desulfolutivibrio sp. TaxID=2773296 RepID=UPI002F962FB7
MTVKRILALVLIAAATAGAWWFFGGDARRHPEPLRLFGNVDIREAELSFRVPGKIAEVRVDEGDPVAAGDIAAVLDARPYRDALAQARAKRDAAAADMAKHHAGYRREDVAKARAQVAQLEAQVENAVRVARRRQTLLHSGAIAAQDNDDAVAARDALTAQLQSAQKELELQTTGFRSEDILAAEAQLRAAEAAVDAALTDLADTEIVVPSDGTVLSRVREPGAVAGAGATVLTIALKKPVWVRAYIPEPLLGRVYPGMPMRVFTDSRPDAPYAARVGYVSPVAEFTPKNVETQTLRTDLVYRVRIIVDAPDEGLRQGMPVTVASAPEAIQTTEGAPKSANRPTVPDPASTPGGKSAP